MSDKKLLEEGTVRRFQALANIKPLSTLSEAKKKKEEEGKKKEEKKVKEEGVKHEEESMEEGISEPLQGSGQSVAEEEEMGDMGAMGSEAGGAEAGGEGGDDVKPAVEALVKALNDLLSKVGKGELEVDVEAGEEDGEGKEEEEEEEEGMVSEETEEEGWAAKKMEEKKKPAEEAKHGMKKMEEKKVKKPAHKKEEEEEEEGVYEALNLEVQDDEALAEELTRRVAARLVAEMKKAKKGMTEDFTGGGTKHAKAPKGHGPSKKPFGASGKGR